ncbi:MAG: hypothetical protein WBV53_12330 [Solirubrobacterales bacterium]
MVHRHSYVVTVREPDGQATVRDVRTGRTAGVRSPAQAAEQIERWLREAREGDGAREDRVSEGA